MYTPIQSSKLFEQIAEQIEERILRGELRSGDRLPSERELSEQFGASRTAVREAMKTLAQRGLVDMRPGRGTIVINATSRAMQQTLELMVRVGREDGYANLVELRELLEPGIAALAAARASEEHLARLRAVVEQMDASLHDVEAYIAADNDFHRTLATASGNRLILTFVDSIVDLLSEQRKHISRIGGAMERAQYHHKRILEAVSRRDAEAARIAMQEHLHQVRQDLETANRG